MTCAAVCTDCGWAFEDDRRERVTDQLERHARKERHHVRFVRRAVDATA